MTNPTSNFGWQMPTPTDLVTDLPADFEVFGQAVDTSMADLKGGTSGQILSKASNTDMDFTWITNDVGDITNIAVTSPITGGGSSGSVTIGVDAASTSASGVVQLSDSTSTTSSVLASTPTATKAAYDLANTANTTANSATTTANNAIAKSTVTTAGDIIYRNGSAPTRLGIGTAGQVLTVNSGATAPEWKTTSVPGMVQISQTVLGTAAASIVLSSIPSTYTNLKLVYTARGTSAIPANTILLRINADTSANYDQQTIRAYGGTVQGFDLFAQTSFELGSIATATAAAGLSGSGEIEIPNYKGTSFNKTIISSVNHKEGTASGNIREVLTAGYWRNSAAITSLTLLAGGNNLDVGTVVTLYGEL